MGKAIETMTPAERIAAIRTKLAHWNSDWTPRAYLQTNCPELNAVFGSADDGIPYGKLLELSGPESNGKTAVALDLMAMAQAAGAAGFWLDAENSFENKWARKRKVNTKALYKFRPYVGTFGKEVDPRMVNAQELCAELEAAILMNHRIAPSIPKFAVVDSVTALLTQEESKAGIESQNMRTKLSLAAFLNQLLRRWVGLCQATDTTILFINQLRIDPTKMFGNPEYSPGGKALKFYCHGRAKLRRTEKGGFLMRGPTQVGIKGVITVLKNKMGGEEGNKVGYRIYWDGRSQYSAASKVQGKSKAASE